MTETEKLLLSALERLQDDYETRQQAWQASYDSLQSMFTTTWGCKPEPPKFPSCQFHPFHKGIQVNHLAVTLKGIVSVQQNVSPSCRRYLGKHRERLGVTCCFALR